MPFDHVVVSVGGVVKPCAYATNDFIEMSDGSRSVGAMLRDERFEALRQRILAGDPPEMCRRCPELGMYNTLQSGIASAERVFELLDTEEESPEPAPMPPSPEGRPGRVFSREQLLNAVWGSDVYVETRTVDVHIRRLRKSLEPSGHDRLVQTVRGSGYRLADGE